jgi:transposase
VNGGGRRPGYSSGRHHCLAIARGSETGGSNSGDHQSPPPGSRPPRSRPKRLVGDKAYDSDQLRARLGSKGIRLLVPYRRNRKTGRKQSAEAGERYQHRWKIERTFAWLGNFRRLVVRYERLLTVYPGFFHLACIIIALRQFCNGFYRNFRYFYVNYQRPFCTTHFKLLGI